jgi:hypothetical protein
VEVIVFDRRCILTVLMQPKPPRQLPFSGRATFRRARIRRHGLPCARIGVVIGAVFDTLTWTLARNH